MSKWKLKWIVTNVKCFIRIRSNYGVIISKPGLPSIVETFARQENLLSRNYELEALLYYLIRGIEFILIVACSIREQNNTGIMISRAKPFGSIANCNESLPLVKIINQELLCLYRCMV